MATIKTQGGKVILKNGKVSCTCCEGECCLYPAQALVDNLYTIDDLPDEIIGSSNNFSKANPPIDASIQVGVPYLIYYGVLGEGVGIAGGSNVWSNQNDNSFASIERECLISYLPPETQGGDPFVPDPDWYVDDFADTYTVTWNISDQSGSSTATRQSPCIWIFTALGAEYLIEYESVDFFRWRIVAPDTEIFKAEPSFENTPTGYYETGNQDFTVS